MDHLFVPVMLCILFALVALFGWAIYAGVTATKIELIKGEWECSHSTIQMVGKLSLPVCTQYTRN